MQTKDVIDRIFKEPGIQYELTEFENLGKPIHEILAIYPKVVATGKDAGKTKYFLKSLILFSSGNEEVQVYVEGGKSAPEEIIRQLWVYKLIHQYAYQADQIDLEKSVQFGTEIALQRGARRAREKAWRHGVPVVYSEDGVIKYEFPQPETADQGGNQGESCTP